MNRAAGSSRLLLIGCATYQDHRLPDLPGVTRNVDRLCTLLAGGQPQPMLKVLHNPSSPDTVLTALDQAAREASDMLVVYYAGHGVAHVGTRLYLALREMDPARPHRSAGIDAQVLCENIGRSPARCKVLILDCCHSGRALACPVWDDPAAGEYFVWVATGPDAAAQQFSPGGGRAFDGAAPTVFTELLIHQLQQAGTVSLERLAESVGTALEFRGFPRPAYRSAHGAETRCLHATPANPPPALLKVKGRAAAVRTGRLLVALTFVPSAVLFTALLVGDVPAGWFLPWLAAAAAGVAQHRLRSSMPSRRVLYIGPGGLMLDLGTQRYALLWTEVEEIAVLPDSRVLVRLRPGSTAHEMRGLWGDDGPQPAAGVGLLQFCTLRAFASDRGQAENAIAENAQWRWRNSDAFLT